MGRGMRGGLVGVAAMAGVAIARDARPCVDLVPTRVLPASSPAPINTRVWIHQPPLRLRGNPMKPPAPSFDVDVVLREIAPVIADVPAKIRECPYKLLEVIPTTLLAKNARFEVWMIPTSGSGRRGLLASFVTSDVRDDTPPEAPAVKSAYFTKETIKTSCATTFPIALLGIAPPPDELYAVWAAGPTGTIVWDSPPMALLGGTLLDTYATCMTEYPAWAASSPRLGLRSVDLAGNLSEPVILDVQ